MIIAWIEHCCFSSLSLQSIFLLPLSLNRALRFCWIIQSQASLDECVCWVCVWECTSVCECVWEVQWRREGLFLGFRYVDREKIKSWRVWWIDFFLFFPLCSCFGHVLQLLLDKLCRKPALYLQSVLAHTAVQSTHMHKQTEGKSYIYILNQRALLRFILAT